MKNSGWKHNKKTNLVVGNESTPTKVESGQVIINKKATKENLDRLIEINKDGSESKSGKVTTDGTNGGLLKGKPHYDKNGNPLGGIPMVVDGSKKIEAENDEFLLNKEASKKHWKELSKINQSAGNGVPINPSDVGSDDDPQDFKEGGRIIEFNPNHLPKKVIYNYAKMVKDKYPKVWDLGGNIFGNEAFRNLERALKRGYWTDNEEWMYIKWRSYVARHKQDFRIAGVIAMLKWVDVVDRGWDYMKDLIEKEIDKRYPKKKTGGAVTYKQKYNKKYNYDTNETHDLSEVAKDTGVSEKGLQQIFNKGVGAYNTNPESVRPNVKSEEQWAMGRVYSAVMGGKAARVDANELKMSNGGGVEYSALKEILEKAKPFQKELTERWVKKVKEKGEINLSDWDIEMYEFMLVMDLTKAIGNYLEKTDSIKDLKFSKDQSSIVISCLVIRNGEEYKFQTEVIVAGGYNIQQLHLRYIVHTKLPNKRTNPEYEKLNEQYKKMTKAQKIQEQIYNAKLYIAKYEVKVNEAKENSKLSDSEVEKLSRKYKPDSWRTNDTSWEMIVERGADKNFDYSKEKYLQSQKEYKDYLIKSWRTFNANYTQYENMIKREQKEIDKFNKKLAELGVTKMEKGGLIAPNGNKSNLTAEQYQLVRTPEFKAWFGDWENEPKNASKVVDENGEPLVVYHGSSFNFYEFDRKKIGSNYVQSEQGGFFFTQRKQSAENYAKLHSELKSKGFVYECFLNIKNPLIRRTNSDYYNPADNYDINRGEYIRALFIDELLDGIIILGTRKDNLYVVNNSNQIKLADGSNTTFETDSKDIRYDNGGSTSWDKLASASSRFRPYETIVFEPPLIGLNDAKLTSYTWAYEMTMQPNWEGELVGKRVSDWSQAETSAETGRGIVHRYSVELPNSEVKIVSSESVPILLGYQDRTQAKVFGNLATASKTLAKQQMALAIMEAKYKEYLDAIQSVKDKGFPEPHVEKSESLSGYKLFVGDGSCYINENGTYDRERLDCAKSNYINNRLKEMGIDVYSANRSSAIYDLKNRVARQKRKVEQMLKTPNMELGGNIENSDLTEMTLNRVYTGEINSDDAAIELDESGIEVDHDLYERLRDAEKGFLNKNRGLQVGDTITVKGKHGNSDFKGNFRGFTNEGKLVVVYGGGNQMVIGKDDYYENGGTTDDFDWESLFNPSPEQQEKIRQEIKKSEEQEKEDWYQNSRFSKKWAATYQDAVNRTVKEYLDAKATYEDWGSRQYKQNKGMVFLGGDDVFGEAKSIGSINEGRRQRVMRGAKMLMDESIETLKDLGLTDEEISNLLNNKMQTGGITENHEDLESKIMNQQFGI